MKKSKKVGYSIVRFLLKIFQLIFMRIKFEGLENIPSGSEGYILAGTHVSVLDPLIIGDVTKRQIHFLAKKELFDIFFVGWVLRKIGIIKVDRSAKENPQAKSEAVDALLNNEIVCVFPEGTTRKEKNKLLPFKYGAVSFASKTGKPIIPFAINGNPHLFNYHIKVIIGKAMVVKDNIVEANKKLEDEVRKLMNEKERRA